jgi:hypothetical protein
MSIKCAYGGQPISDQMAMIKRGGIHILCASTGRLIDLLQSNCGRVLNFRRIISPNSPWIQDLVDSRPSDPFDTSVVSAPPGRRISCSQPMASY